MEETCSPLTIIVRIFIIHNLEVDFFLLLFQPMWFQDSDSERRCIVVPSKTFTTIETFQNCYDVHSQYLPLDKCDYVFCICVNFLTEMGVRKYSDVLIKRSPI